MELSVGHTPDADDAFMFYGMFTGKVTSPDFTVTHVIEDIENLNNKATSPELDVTAVSVHACAYIPGYTILRSGGSFGIGYGPIVTSTKEMTINELQKAKIAIPGKMTSAFLLLQLMIGKFNYVEMNFSDIPLAVKNGKVDAGLVIHETQLSYSQEGIIKILHVGMITINGEKMSKSLGNVKSVSHVLENWGPNIIRLFCLSGSYSKPIDYSEILLKENITKLRQIESCYYELRLADGIGDKVTVEKLVNDCKNEFNSALNNDLNTSLALTIYYKLIREVNSLSAEEKLTVESAKIILPEFERMSDILGIKILKVSDDEKNEINQMIKKRDEYRAEKNYDEADKIREQIAGRNIIFVDHKNKTRWIKQEKIKAE